MWTGKIYLIEVGEKMNLNKTRNIDELCDIITLNLLEKYYEYKGNKIASIFDIYFKEKFGGDIEQKVKAEAQIIKKINESIKVVEMLSQYQEILAKLEKEQPIYSINNLLSFVGCDNCSTILNENYTELKQTQKSIADELIKFGISSSWLERNGLCERKKAQGKALQAKVSPQKEGESGNNYLKRILKGISDYDQAIQIYANGTATSDLLLYDRLKKLRTYLILQGIVPANFSVKILYDDIRMVKK